jgi:hypothetical protein
MKRKKEAMHPIYISLRIATVATKTHVRTG